MPASIPPILHQGYARFRQERYAQMRQSYAALEEGQAPETLIIACADSRVDPATIFDAAPGDLFVIRNVAALVPHYQADFGMHGVSSALEFGIKVLGIKSIIVMGHGQCGGVDLCLHQSPEDQSDLQFVSQWVELAAPAREAVNQLLPNGTPEERQLLAEYKTVGVSLTNLLSFPFVQEKVTAGQLTLHGAWYSVHEGQLLWRDPQTEEFSPIKEA